MSVNGSTVEIAATDTYQEVYEKPGRLERSARHRSSAARRTEA